MSVLVKYDAARYALQQAVEIDEVKEIRDKAEAMAAYARQAKDTEMIQWVTEIKVRAERKAGEMLASMEKHPGAKGVGSNQHEVRSHDVTAPKLSDLGITKNESSRWQKLAAIPETQFEQAVSAAKEVAGEVTTAAMLRIERAQTGKVKPKEAVDQDETYTETDHLIDQLRGSVSTLSEENDRLANIAATQVFEGSDEDRAALLGRLDSLVAENKQLRIELDAVKSSRDGYQRENAQLKNQLRMQRKQLGIAA